MPLGGFNSRNIVAHVLPRFVHPVLLLLFAKARENMCVDKCVEPWTSAPPHRITYRHIYRCTYRDVCGKMYRHACRHVHRLVCRHVCRPMCGHAKHVEHTYVLTAPSRTLHAAAPSSSCLCCSTPARLFALVNASAAGSGCSDTKCACMHILVCTQGHVCICVPASVPSLQHAVARQRHATRHE